MNLKIHKLSGGLIKFGELVLFRFTGQMVVLYLHTTELEYVHESLFGC